MRDEQSVYCPICAEVSLVEAPPCPDGHGAQCPERVCLQCGMALVLAAPQTQPRRAAPGRAA